MRMTNKRGINMLDMNSYKQCIEDIRRYASENNVSDLETTKIFNNCFQILEKKDSRIQWTIIKLIKIVLLINLSVIGCLIFLYNHPSFHSIFLRNLQTSIYPGLKVLRNIAVPIINHYPALAELYDEWCLLENPYFYVHEIDCWPCSIVQSVPDLTGHNITKSFNIGIPYTKTEKVTQVDISTLSEAYWNNSDTFERDAYRVFSNNPTYCTIKDVFSKRLDLFPSEFSDTHILWRINRMKPSRILREVFPKPEGTPEWYGQSMEKYIFIDESNAPAYTIPNPECSNVAIRCSAGSRLIKMEPSLECRQNCRPSTILLSSGHILWYNWWYWRPVSIPVLNTSAISINYLTSYC